MPPTVYLPYPEPRQVDVLDSPARFKVPVCGRRWGKTCLGIVAGTEGHGGGRGALQGGEIMWIAPAYPEIVASGVWRSLKHALRHVWIDKSETDRRLVLPGGGSWVVRSAENPDSLRGPGLDGFVLDETATCKEEVWQEVLRPAVSDRQGWGIFVGTPKGINWYYRLYESATNRDGWSRWQRPTSENPRITPAELEEARLDVGELAFRQEYLAEFVTAGAGMFKREWFRYYTLADSTFLLDGSPVSFDSLTRFATVDLAASLKTKANYTAIASWGLTTDRKLILLDMLRARLGGPDIVPAMQRAVERWRLDAIWIERTGFQLSLIQQAAAAGLPARELDADGDKVARALPATARLEQGRVWFPRVAAWLDLFETELCSFPEGEYKDQVDVLSYAVAVASGLHQRVSLLGVARPSPRPVPVGPLDEPEEDRRPDLGPRRPARFGPRRPR